MKPKIFLKLCLKQFLSTKNFLKHPKFTDNLKQAYTSVAKSPVDLKNQGHFSRLMHTFHFHSTLIDDQSSLLEYTSDLSLFCWYQDLFKRRG